MDSVAYRTYTSFLQMFYIWIYLITEWNIWLLLFHTRSTKRLCNSNVSIFSVHNIFSNADFQEHKGQTCSAAMVTDFDPPHPSP